MLRYGENPHQKGVFYGDLDAMFDQLHGKRYTTSSTNVTQVYEIFNAALMKGPSAHSGIFHQCNLWNDGLFHDENLTQKEKNMILKKAKTEPFTDTSTVAPFHPSP